MRRRFKNKLVIDLRDMASFAAILNKPRNLNFNVKRGGKEGRSIYSVVKKKEVTVGLEPTFPLCYICILTNLTVVIA